MTSWCRQVEKSLHKQKIVDVNALFVEHCLICEYFTQFDPPNNRINNGPSHQNGASTNQIESLLLMHFCEYVVYVTCNFISIVSDPIEP